ncbi:hypothetical protein Zm00014a_036706 [Zea mays]|uniref:Uncharacterized protein n=1 Tax=Zea mays TaxID=4577 RepID=A0A3L6DKX4_MAIZE|nr:hypothetical protein Zm00014a_036706 [Zea mays]
MEFAELHFCSVVPLLSLPWPRPGICRSLLPSPRAASSHGTTALLCLTDARSSSSRSFLAVAVACLRAARRLLLAPAARVELF